jgi:hypothetical protein
MPRFFLCAYYLYTIEQDSEQPEIQWEKPVLLKVVESINREITRKLCAVVAVECESKDMLAQFVTRARDDLIERIIRDNPNPRPRPYSNKPEADISPNEVVFGRRLYFFNGKDRLRDEDIERRDWPDCVQRIEYVVVIDVLTNYEAESFWSKNEILGRLMEPQDILINRDIEFFDPDTEYKNIPNFVERWLKKCCQIAASANRYTRGSGHTSDCQTVDSNNDPIFQFRNIAVSVLRQIYEEQLSCGLVTPQTIIDKVNEVSVQKLNLDVYNYLQDNPCVDIAKNDYAKAVMFILRSCTNMKYKDIMTMVNDMRIYPFPKNASTSALTHHLRAAEKFFNQYIEPAFIKKIQQGKKRR